MLWFSPALFLTVDLSRPKAPPIIQLRLGTRADRRRRYCPTGVPGQAACVTIGPVERLKATRQECKPSKVHAECTTVSTRGVGRCGMIASGCLGLWARRRRLA